MESTVAGSLKKVGKRTPGDTTDDKSQQLDMSEEIILLPQRPPSTKTDEVKTPIAPSVTQPFDVPSISNSDSTSPLIMVRLQQPRPYRERGGGGNVYDSTPSGSTNPDKMLASIVSTFQQRFKQANENIQEKAEDTEVRAQSTQEAIDLLNHDTQELSGALEES